MLGMYRSERKIFGCSFVASIGTHLSIVVLLFLLSFAFQSSPPPQPPEEKPVDVEFTSDSSGQEAPAKSEQDTSNPNAPAPEKMNAPPSPVKPLNAPIEEAPPPPPPPQPLPPPPESVAKVQALQPVQEQSIETPADSAVTLPPAVAPLASSGQSKSSAPPSPAPVPDALPTEQTFSKITKPEKAKQEAPDTHSLEATMNSYRADQKQTHPPRSSANPRQGGAPNGGGSKTGDITKGLSAGQQGKIAASVRRCYTQDTAAKNYASFVAHMIVTVDSAGEARMVSFDASTQAKMNSDPAYRAFAERSRDAVLSPTCSKLPIPSDKLGARNTIRFVFRP